MYNLTEVATGGAEPGYKMESDAVTNDFGTFFGVPTGISLGDQLIDASVGETVIQARLVDSSADDTAAMAGFYRCLALQYTVEQARMSAVHNPQLITGG